MHIKTETAVGLFIIAALIIFFYMTFFLGVFRFDRMQYNRYIVYFSNVAGLEKKADVKIAGVKVGWIESITLLDKDTVAVQADIRVHKKYTLRADAHAIVRQDSFLGTKYLEIIPGDPLLPEIKPNEALGIPGTSPASIDAILHRMQSITQNVEDITSAFKENFGGVQGKEQLKTMVENLQVAVERFAGFASTLDRTLGNNENIINSIMTDFKDVVEKMRDVFPSIKDNISQVSNRINTDVERLSDKFENATSIVEQAAEQVRDGFKNIGSVAQKLDEGKGLLGKMINEEETYKDLKISIQGLRQYFTKMDALSIVFDSHGEYMYGRAEHVNFEDAKGYMDIRIHPNDDHFYVLQYVMAQKGSIARTIRQVKWFDENCKEILSSEMINIGRNSGFGPDLVGQIEVRERVLDQAKLGAQIGKIYKDLALRIGIFENSAGFGIDFNIPFGTDKFRWVTTLEAFDFRGRDRFDDKRPHFKWLNRVFILRNLYFAFGADDFVSKQNANGFFGAGLRFCDDDIKYFINQLGITGLS